MIHGTSVPAARGTSSRVPPSTPLASTTGITIYGCGHDEAALFEEMAPCFGVLPRITAAAISEHNLALAHGNRCISVGHRTRVADSTLLALRRSGVRHITTRSVGSNHLDVRYAESLGISVATVSYSPDSVADYTLMLMLMAVRAGVSTIRRADAHDYRSPEIRGRELRDLTIGVVGTGRIGTAVIDRLRGFGCRVLAHDRRAVGPEWVSLDELTARSDVVTLHTPLTADTHHLLDRRRIERMKPGAYVINTARGSLLDTEALLDALESGALGGAALDVLEGEEGIFYSDCRSKAIGNPLLARLKELPNVLISPHIAYFTDHALRDTVESTLLSCSSFESPRDHG